MIHIDGSFGEGGGQILRSSLALSIVTGKPFRIDKIRAGRQKPGLMRQHLTAAQAAAQICAATLDGDRIGSTALSFAPRPVKPGDYHFSVGTAGSITLVLQTVLLPLLLADEPSRLTLEGGTHNPHAPPFDFLASAYLPLINRMGPNVAATLERPGFYPAGGGRLVVDIDPARTLRGIELMRRGEARSHRARALIANLPRHIAERELRVVTEKLNWPQSCVEVMEVAGSHGPGNVLMLEVAHEHVTELFIGFGEVGRPAEAVASDAVRQCRRYLKAAAPVGEYLTDQLMLPLAIAGEGGFACTRLSRHATTHLQLIAHFLDTRVDVDRLDSGETNVRFGAAASHQ